MSPHGIFRMSPNRMRLVGALLLRAAPRADPRSPPTPSPHPRKRFTANGSMDKRLPLGLRDGDLIGKRLAIPT